MASLAIPLLTAGISGLAGLFSSQPKTTTGTQNQTSTQTYNYTPQQQELINNLMQQYQSQLSGADLSGYQSSGIQQINNSSDASQQAINNMLAQRGLLNSPAAATALTQNRVGQAGQQSQFLNSLPLLQYQLKSQALTNAGNFSNSQRVNSTTQSNGTFSQTGPGNQVGRALTGFGTGIAATLGKRFAQQGS